MRGDASTAIKSLPKRKAEFIEPMECALVANIPEGPGWTYEVKLDGYHAIGVKGRETILYSMRGEESGYAVNIAKAQDEGNDGLRCDGIEASGPR